MIAVSIIHKDDKHHAVLSCQYKDENAESAGQKIALLIHHIFKQENLEWVMNQVHLFKDKELAQHILISMQELDAIDNRPLVEPTEVLPGLSDYKNE